MKTKEKLKLKDRINFKEILKSIKGIKIKKVGPTIIAVTVLVLILIFSFVLFFEINDYRKVREEKYSFYYYFIKSKIEFEGTISINGQDTILDLSSDQVSFNSTPVYYKDYVGQMILPYNMEIVNPYKKFPMYKLGAYSKIYYKDDDLYVDSEAGTGKLYDCFLYDGENLYVFLEKTTVKIGEQEYSLSPLSFIEVDKTSIRIYDFYSDKYEFIENTTETAVAYTDEYMIELSRDSFSYNNSYYLLIKSVDALDLYEF